VIIILELTGDYRIILPLMFAIVLATGMSKFLSADTIHTLKLRRRGIDIMRGRGANLMRLLTVADAMRPLPPPVSAGTAFAELIALVTDGAPDGLIVVDDDGEYVGVIGPHEIEQSMRESSLGVLAGELAERPPSLKTDRPLEGALDELLRRRSGLPVSSRDSELPIGC
jgi:CIC family chloride channel protein